MNANERAGAFAIQVQIADMKLTPGLLQLFFVGAVDGSSQTELGVIGDPQSIVVILRLDYGQHRSKNFFLLDSPARLHIGDDRRLDKEALFAIGSAASDDAPTLGLALF